MKRGVITKSTGKYYLIKEDETDVVHTGIIRGKFKLNGFKLTNPVAVGDRVAFTLDTEYAIISSIENRKNYVVRQSPRKKHFLHLLAANIDLAMVVVTIREPMLKQGFIDRFLLMTEPYNIPTTIIFNKSDLWDEGDQNVYDYLYDIYSQIGYTVMHCSAIDADSVQDIKTLLTGKTTLISGQSGVGKSTLINQIIPDVNIVTQDISEYSGKGQHTTTFAEMYTVDHESNLIDTPGIKMLSYNHLEVMDVAHNFREFFETSKECKFADCTHRNEPKCAVKDGLESGVISQLRYANYLQILDDIENQNYWERITDY